MVSNQISIGITTNIIIDEVDPVDQQIIASSRYADYDFDLDDDNVSFLKEIEGKTWKELDQKQRLRAIQWMFSDMVYPGIVDFNYGIVFPGDLICPICLKPMEVFDESGDFGKRYVCGDCDKIVSIIKVDQF